MLMRQSSAKSQRLYLRIVVDGDLRQIISIGRINIAVVEQCPELLEIINNKLSSVRVDILVESIRIAHFFGHEK